LHKEFLSSESLLSKNTTNRILAIKHNSIFSSEDAQATEEEEKMDAFLPFCLYPAWRSSAVCECHWNFSVAPVPFVKTNLAKLIFLSLS